MSRYYYVIGLLIWAIACSQNRGAHLPESGLSGKVLAAQHCGSCHLPVSPDLLPKSVWEHTVLPVMGLRMGIYEGTSPPDSFFDGRLSRELVEQAGIFPKEPILHPNDWEKIVAYYLSEAPDEIPAPVKILPIADSLTHFTYRRPAFSITPSLCIMVRIIPEQQAIAFSDGKKNVSSLAMLDSSLQERFNLFLDRTPIDVQAFDDTLYLTSVGKKVYPSDERLGIIEKVYSSPPGESPNRSTVLLEGLQRPVHVRYADLDADGLTDILVCEYGFLLGKLAWYKNEGGDTYTPQILSNEPGATATEIRDIDGDGLPDIIALMAQGREGIFLYRNSPNGFLPAEPLLTFSPLAGSTYFELVDFNDDGHLDILYTSGDNADLSRILKSYHGIYVYLNDGTFHFEQAYFFQMNGAYKALAHDYDLDGDLDLAAISFFPDYSQYPEEAFVYLENEGNMHFTASSFPEVRQGRWMVMDANDWDQDGDIDLALGSFVSFEPQGDTTGMYEEWLQNGPSAILLENTIR